MTERQQLMNTIQMYDFAIYDLHLYLDTHPYCKNALSYFNRYNKLRKAAWDEYAEKYGPITAAQMNSDEHWHWIDGPWPWSKEVN